MGKASPFELQKHTVNLYAGDFDKLSTLFPNADKSTVLRNILHDFIAKIEAGSVKELPQVEVSL